jgi:hypothetical protein
MSQIDLVREGLLELHKTLLDAVRVDYEREHGRVETAGALLQLVVSDPAFDWLRPLSQLIVAIDELEPDAGPKVVVEMVEALMERDPKFSQTYQAWLQASPDVVMQHGKTMKSVRALRFDA